MAIKNYTTQIPVEKTVGEIEVILSKNGAQRILKEYFGDGSVKAISFIVMVNDKPMAFQLPIEIDAWVALLNLAVDERKLPYRFRDDSAQASRVGWRVIKDWVDAQLALVQTKTVKIHQVFLPYAVTRSGKTLFQEMEDKQFKHLQLTEGTVE